MKAIEIKLGREYWAKVSGRLSAVKITSSCPYGGWYGVNQDTGHEVRIKTAGRLRCPVTMRVGQTIEKNDHEKKETKN